ncbi:MAG: hypothetical protein ACREUO_00480, partial [Burkholderiales bacterium]
AEAAHKTALQALAVSSPEDFPNRYEAALGSWRAAATARGDLEDLAGMRPLPQVPEAQLVRFVELRGQALRMEERLATAQGVERAAAAITLRLKRLELDHFVRRLGAEPPDTARLARAALRQDVRPLEAAYRDAAAAVDRAMAALDPTASPDTLTALRAALRERLAAELRLEEHRATVETAARALRAERDLLLRKLEPPRAQAGEAGAKLLVRLQRLEARVGVLDHALARGSRAALAREIERIEQRLQVTPTLATLRSYTEAVERLRLIERRLETVRHRGSPPRGGLGHSPHRAPLPDLEPLRAELGKAGARVLTDPNPRAITAYREAVAAHSGALERHDVAAAWREYAGARRDVRVLLREVTTAPPEAARRILGRWREVIDRYHVAQHALGEHLTSPPPPSPAGPFADDRRLQALLARLRHDDAPDHLADLEREVLARLAHRTGMIAAPPAPPIPPDTLPATIRGFRGARLELLRAAREATREPAPLQLERLRRAIASYHDRSAHLELAAELHVRLPRAPLIRPALFLRHPTLAGAPARAAVAWAVYAARKGLPRAAIAAALVRAAAPRLFSLPLFARVDDPSLVASIAVLWV